MHAHVSSILEAIASDPATIRHLNRELSWLQFNERILALTADNTVPLLARARFLGIFQSNLDEFFQVRVAGLHQLVKANTELATPDGMSITAQLEAVREYSARLRRQQAHIFNDLLRPELAANGFNIVNIEDLSVQQRHELSLRFRRDVYPVLTPLTRDPAHPFPYISDLSTNIAVKLLNETTDTYQFARIKVPDSVQRLFPISPDVFLPIEQLVAAELDTLFSGRTVTAWHLFRIIRNADLTFESEEVADLIETLEHRLVERHFGAVVKIEAEPDMDVELLRLLCEEFELKPADVVEVDGPLDLRMLGRLPTFPGGDYLPRVPRTTAIPQGTTTVHEGWFARINQGDVLVHHPYDAFSDTVEQFLTEAAFDANVVTIKITLYRTSGVDSSVMRILLEAARRGKQVVVLLELTARFDEAANISWARTLERAGVHVAYGVVGMKTHTKIALVVRRESDGLATYAHIATGNYNEDTACLYEDLGMFTADRDVNADVGALFNVLTGYAAHPPYRHLVVAPVGFRQRILDEIASQTRKGTSGHITFKMNALIDEETIEALYDASNQGVTVDLIVRGICTLRPGMPGLSENIRVRSLLGRYLEHSRIYRFGAPHKDGTILIGSGDLMPRNLDRRIEVLVPVTAPDARTYLDAMLSLYLADDTLAWELSADSVWRRTPTKKRVNTHETLYTWAVHHPPTPYSQGSDTSIE
ncbi:MAG: polyphosphate kinase 1 [Nitriliruptoraceae bacterium]